MIYYKGSITKQHSLPLLRYRLIYIIRYNTYYIIRENMFEPRLRSHQKINIKTIRAAYFTSFFFVHIDLYTIFADKTI